MKDLLKLIMLQPYNIPAELTGIHFLKRQLKIDKDSLDVSVKLESGQILTSIFISHNEADDEAELKYAISHIMTELLNYEARKVLRSGDTDEEQ